MLSIEAGPLVPLHTCLSLMVALILVNRRGYMLKPDWMRNVNPQEPVPNREARNLNVHVFSAYRPQVRERSHTNCLGVGAHP